MGEDVREKKQTKKNKNNFKYVSIILVIVLVVVFAFVIYGNNGEIVAKVNGEKIKLSEVNRIYNSLPPQQQLSVTKEDVLNGLIQSKVLYQEAEKQGYSVNDEEVMQEVDSQISSLGITKEQFLESLSSQGLTEEEFTEQYSEQLVVQNFIDEVVLVDIEFSSEEIEDYYENNIEQFRQGKTVTARHILVEDEELAMEIEDDVNHDNFCELVEEHSQDPGSVGNCGEYTFTKDDPLDQDFKDLSFSQGIGKIGTVNTQFGTHVIWTVSKEPAKTLKLEEVSSQIEEFLKAEKSREVFESFYEELEENSDIEILSEEF